MNGPLSRAPHAPTGGPRAPRARFLSRGGRAAAVSLSCAVATLALGILGYHDLAGVRWLIAFHQAALPLSGTGPVATNLPDVGRAFESVCSLFCGVVLLGATGILFAPALHRLRRKFHVEDTGSR
jgi:hypothetical protein